MDKIERMCDEKQYMNTKYYKNYHNLPKFCFLIYTLGTWIKTRLEESWWLDFNREISNNLGLLSAIIRSLVYKALQEQTWL